MTDRIISLSVSGEDILGLSEMGNLYHLKSDESGLTWFLVLTSPEIGDGH